MGDVTNMQDEERTKECLRITGADKVVARFPKGLDARLGPYPADDSPQSLLKEYIQESKTGGYDPWEEEYGKTIERDIELDEEYDDSVIGSSRLKNKDCAFSPGQWSKLVIARALMKKSADLRSVIFTVLLLSAFHADKHSLPLDNINSIFDEPTAKLDPIASRAIFDEIEKLRGSCTVVHITHDLSACLKADQVILFDDGCNVESGTHEALLAKANSKYGEFYKATLGHQNDEDEDDDGETEEAENEEDDGGSVEEEDEEAEAIQDRPDGEEESEAEVDARTDNVEATGAEGTGEEDNGDEWEDEEDEENSGESKLASHSESLSTDVQEVPDAMHVCACEHHDGLDSTDSTPDGDYPSVILLSVIGHDHDHEDLSESVEDGLAHLGIMRAGVSPEDAASRFEEIHDDGAEEGEEEEGDMGDEAEEAEEEDDGNDSGFENSSQSSFCPEQVLPASTKADLIC